MPTNPYQIGDPVVDLAQGRPMLVLEAPDQTVAEWSDANGYDLQSNYANSKFDPADDEPVVRTAYVSDVRSEPSKDYTFPSSRVALIDAHHADDGRRVSDRVAVDTLATVFEILDGDEGPHRTDGLADRLEAEGVAPDVVSEARELAAVETVVGSADDD